MTGSRHLSTAQRLLWVGAAMVLVLGVLALLDVEVAALEVLAGLGSTLILTVGGVGGVSASRHLGEGLRKPTTPGE